MQINRLVINKSKSHFILIGAKTGKIFDLTRTTKAKVVGVTIDNHLNFDPHMEEMSKQLSNRVGVIGRVKYLFTQKAMLFIYKALIQSILIYSCHVWIKPMILTLRNL
jgi:hypothetical protein